MVKKLLKRIKRRLKKMIISFLAPFRRIGLKNKDFSIIANNCWGGIVYRDYGIRYLTPTVGLYMFSKEYIKFLSNLEYYLTLSPVEVKMSESKYEHFFYEKHGRDDFVIGKLGDIEIIFLHYDNFEDASLKWELRKKRVNFDNLVVKFNDQNMFDIEDYYDFEKLPFRNKIFFTANETLKNNKDVYYFDEFKNANYVISDAKEYKKYFNVKKYLNNMKQKGDE